MADHLSRLPQPEADTPDVDDPAVWDESYYLRSLANAVEIESEAESGWCEYSVTWPKEHTLSKVALHEADVNSTHNADDVSSDPSATPTTTVDLTQYDIPALQRDDPFCRVMIDYLTVGSLPTDDAAARKLVFEAEHYVIEDDVLFRLRSPRKRRVGIDEVVKVVVVPKCLTPELLSYYHGNIGGHWKILKSYETVRSKYFWEGMYADIQKFIRTCPECQIAQPDRHPLKSKLRPLDVPFGRFSRLQIDYLQLAKSGKYEYVLVICCSLSGWVEVYKTESTDANTAASCLVDFVLRWGGVSVRSSVTEAVRSCHHY